jgi:hypothetical protein
MRYGTPSATMLRARISRRTVASQRCTTQAYWATVRRKGRMLALMRPSG